MTDRTVIRINDVIRCVPVTRAMPAFAGDVQTYLHVVFEAVAKEAAEDALRSREQGYSCYEAAAQMLPAMLQHAHGHGVITSVCDDGSVLMELGGNRWRVFVSFEPDPAKSGWSCAHVDGEPPISVGPLDEIEKLWYWLDAHLGGGKD